MADLYNDSGTMFIATGTLGSNPATAQSATTIATVSSAISSFQAGLITSVENISDSAISVQSNLDTLQSIAAAGKLGTVTLTDAAIQTLSMTAAQESADALLLSKITNIVNLNVTGSSGNDTITAGAGNDTVNGGGGINTVVYALSSTNYTINLNGGVVAVTDNTSASGIDTLTNIQRLQFSDTKLALDISGNAGTTAKILGEVFGASSLSNKQYVGIGLSYLDSGMSYTDLMALALQAAGATTNTAVVNLLWTNIFGSAPTTAQASPYVAMLDNHTYTAGSLGVIAADLNATSTSHVNLVGLAATGIQYT